MNRILLIARREFLANVVSRGFLVLLFLMPIFAVMSAVVTALAAIHEPPKDAIVLVDRAGDEDASIRAIKAAFAIERERAEIRFLAGLAKGEGVAAPAGAVWAWPRRLPGPEDLVRFERDGGVDAVMKNYHLEDREGARPEAPWFLASLPAGIAPDLSEPALREALDGYFQGNQLIEAPDGRHRLLSVVIVSSVDPAAVTIMTAAAPERVLVDLISNALAPGARPPVQITIDEPAPHSFGQTHQGDLGKLVGRIASTLLFVVIMTITGFLLQGMFEERSSRLLEMLLAAVTPTELMAGKLIGVGGLALVVSVVWVGTALLGLAYAPPPFSDLTRPVLAILLQPGMIFWMVVYLIAGYLVIAPIYVTIGSLADSPQDAQAFLIPVLVVVVLPTLAIGPLISQGGSTLVEIMSWIPIYAPIVMLGRVGVGDVSVAERLGTSLEIALFIALEIRYLGRVFRHGILRTGKPPKFKELGGLMRREPVAGDRDP
jgi:ABC-type Na+ efflux pump permease subunit